MAQRQTISPQESVTVALARSRKLLGRRVAAARALTGLSQGAFAVECGLTRNALSGIENGTRGLLAEELYLIAKGSDQPVEWFFEGLDTRV